MKLRVAFVGLAVGASLAAACKKKEAVPAAGTGTGAAGGTAGGTAAPTPPPPRPSQATLQPMPALELPDDPKRDAKVALGHALFFDQRLSVDGSRKCYSCHMNEQGTGGKDPIAIGAGDKPLTRHSPVLWNAGYWKGAYYWDGRAKTLEDQVKGAWAGGNMGVGKDNLDAKAKELGKLKGYQELIAAAFGDKEASADRFAQAIADYLRTVQCTDTAYDRFAKGDKSALTEQQQRGLDVFFGKGGCTACHTPPHFSIAMMTEGGAYFNAGVGIAGKPDDQVDKGRMAVTSSEADWAAFKVPSLRDVSRSAPYFHDGSAATLEEAVKFMASGGLANKNRSPLFSDKQLTPDELADLIAFLGGLDCPGGLTEPKLP